MSSMELNSVKLSFHSILDTLLELLLCCLNIFKSHLFGNRVVDSLHITDRLSYSQSRWSPRLEPFHLVRMSNPARVIKLNEYFPSFIVNCLIHLLPALHLLLIVKTSCSRETSSPQAPRRSFSQDETSSCSLGIVFNMEFSRYAEIRVAPFSSECSHDYSVVEHEISHLEFVIPFGFHCCSDNNIARSTHNNFSIRQTKFN